MTILDESVVDFVVPSAEDGCVYLIATDHLEWFQSKDDEHEHLFALQEKLNAYLAFVESGELSERFPNASGLRVVLKVIGMYPPSGHAQSFYRRMSDVVAAAGFNLVFEQATVSERTKGPG